MNERLKLLRKTLKLNQQKFAEKIGVTPSAISRLETGDINFTDQMIKSICREYNVDYIWLTRGIGEMFIEVDDSDIMDMIEDIMAGENDFHKDLFRTFAKLDIEDIKALERIIDTLLETRSSNDK